MVKRLPGMQETGVGSLGWEDSLEKEMATHSSTLAWKIAWMEELGRLQSVGSQRFRHNWATSFLLLLLLAQMIKNPPAMQETQIWSLDEEDPLEKGMASLSSILTWESRGQRNLVGYSPQGCKELNVTEWLSTKIFYGWETIMIFTYHHLSSYRWRN